MSSRRFEPPLHIELAPSKRLLILLLLIYIGAALLTVFIQVAWGIKITLLALLLASLTVNLYKSGWIDALPWRPPHPLRWQFFPLLTWQADNDWQISTRTGEDVLAQLLPTSTCHPSFVALNLQTEQDNWLDRYISVVIFADAVDEEVFRQLRVRLRTRFVPEQDN
ncbi:MAG: hypothetical protein PVF82_14345 [Gammaproteobacteria bacterium]|jgi:hypothetical protein